MRAHPCARLFPLRDTLTIASMLPGVEGIITIRAPLRAATGHHSNGDMLQSGQIALTFHDIPALLRHRRWLGIARMIGALGVCRDVLGGEQHVAKPTGAIEFRLVGEMN